MLLVGRHLAEECLGYMVIAYLAFSETFPKLVNHWTFSWALFGSPSSFTCWGQACTGKLLTWSIPICMQWYVPVVLFCISLVTNDVKQLFMCSFSVAIYMSLGGSICLSVFPILKSGVTLLLEFMRPFDIFSCLSLPPHHVCVQTGAHVTSNSA